MLDAIHRLFKLMFGCPQPIDFWILGADVLIVLLILWVDVPEKLHQRRIKKNIYKLVSFLNDGQALHDAPPNSQATEEEAQTWSEQVSNWILLVQSFLEKNSKSALSVFRHHGLGQRYGGLRISLKVEKWFYELDVRLKNLRSIMEKPDVYF